MYLNQRLYIYIGQKITFHNLIFYQIKTLNLKSKIIDMFIKNIKPCSFFKIQSKQGTSIYINPPSLVFFKFNKNLYGSLICSNTCLKIIPFAEVLEFISKYLFSIFGFLPLYAGSNPFTSIPLFNNNSKKNPFPQRLQLFFFF